MSEQPEKLASVHTTTFADWLAGTGQAVAVSTYQAGSLVLFRYENGKVNTHFRACERPMGIAVAANRMAVGGERQVIQYRNVPDVATKLEGPTTHDACYLPREIHVTGDIDIHEMAYGQDLDSAAGAQAPPTLWCVNTRFSCLCTLESDSSFAPRWRPPFVSGLSPQDRCHLNGLCLIDGRPKYVTALGATDDAAGWRANKARGGVLLDVESGETIAEGLSMPHSPRWHAGQLWLCESGDGSIGTVDLRTGKYEAVARVDGFTRGFSLLGRYALVGISQIRESAVFSGIPITDRLDLSQRICGVSLIDLTAGREIGFVRFQDAVQELFAVELLPHRFPEVVEQDDELLSSSYVLPDKNLPEVQWMPQPPTDSQKE